MLGLLESLVAALKSEGAWVTVPDLDRLREAANALEIDIEDDNKARFRVVKGRHALRAALLRVAVLARALDDAETAADLEALAAQI